MPAHKDSLNLAIYRDNMEAVKALIECGILVKKKDLRAAKSEEMEIFLNKCLKKQKDGVQKKA